MNDQVYCEICGSNMFTYTEEDQLVCIHCGEPIDDTDIEIMLADTKYMN